MKINFETSKGKFALVKINYKKEIKFVFLYEMYEKYWKMYLNFPNNYSKVEKRKISKEYQTAYNKASKIVPSINDGKVIGFINDLTEEQWEEIVDSFNCNKAKFKYKDYNPNSDFVFCLTAIESGKSLMESLELKEGNWLLIKCL